MEDPRKTPRRWYRTVQQAIRDGWPDKLGGVDLTLGNYNFLGDLKALLVKAGPGRDPDEVRKVALASFRSQSEVKRGRWVVKPTYTLSSGITFANPRAPQPVIESARP